MSDRRLPTTDKARIMALRFAVEKAIDTDFQELSLSPGSIDVAKRVLTYFEYLSVRYRQLYKIEAKAGQSFAKITDSARMYTSHFIQVLFLCVWRAEIKEEQLALYGLDGKGMSVPDLSSNEQLLEWGEKIIAGEYQRIEQGGVPIYNPSIAKVNVIFTLFNERYRTQKQHESATACVLQEVEVYRERVDKIIFEIWEEVERHNVGLPPDKQLARNREYGIVYC